MRAIYLPAEDTWIGGIVSLVRGIGVPIIRLAGERRIDRDLSRRFSQIKYLSGGELGYSCTWDSETLPMEFRHSSTGLAAGWLPL